jgi:hypothetical protein
MEIFPSWSTIAGKAPIDWCEANYNAEIMLFGLKVKVAEYHNTYTNAAYCLAAILLGWAWSIKRVTVKRGHGILIMYTTCLFFTGVTSGLFHATLKWGWQKADEIFENLTVLTLFHATYVDMSDKRSEGRVHLRIMAHSVFAALGIWCIPEVFCEVHLIVLAFASVYRFAYHTGAKLNTSTVFKTASYAIIGFAGWVCDFAFCDKFSTYYLHAYCWHILTGMALYEAGKLLLCLFQDDEEGNTKKRR